MLSEFIAAHREEITDRCKTKVVLRSVVWPSTVESDHGVPVFLGQVVDALRRGLATAEITATALLHGRDRQLQGFSISQLVYDYGDVCQSVAELAIEREAKISVTDFRLLSLCLDHAMAAAVTEHQRGNASTG
jgi:hypothetical protein